MWRMMTFALAAALAVLLYLPRAEAGDWWPGDDYRVTWGCHGGEQLIATLEISDQRRLNALIQLLVVSDECFSFGQPQVGVLQERIGDRAETDETWPISIWRVRLVRFDYDVYLRLRSDQGEHEGEVGT